MIDIRFIIKRNDIIVILLENIKNLAFLAIFISSLIYLRKLKLIKVKQKLTKLDYTIFILLSVSLPLYMFVYLLLLLGT